MAKQLTDEELNLRRKARRRLIGAIALTLAVVVILPMILDSEPNPAGQDIDLRIPAPEEAGKFTPKVDASKLVAMDQLAASSAAPASPEVPAENNKETANQVAAPGKQPAAAVISKKEIPVKAQPVKGNKPEPKGVADVDGFVVQVGAYTNADAAKQELNKLKQWGFKAYTEKAGDKVRVRVGPYVKREQAEKVLKQLEKHGLNPVVMGAR